jgi:hypothetical protein
MANLAIIHDGPIVTLSEARERGLKRYFTGKPCPGGHIAERWVGSSCVECQRLARDPVKNYQRVKAWRKLNPEARTEEARRYRAKYPEKTRVAANRWRKKHAERIRPIEAAKAREKRKSDPEGNRRRVAKFKAKQEAKRAEIAGRPRPSVCDLCRGFNLRIVFDHCHQSGKFRGWLCDRCNKVLGLLKDDPALLRKMARYLERNNGATDGKKEERTPLEGFCGTG